MNANRLAFVKEYKFEKPVIHKVDSTSDNCIRDCHYNYFHTFKYILYNINFTNIRNNEKINLPISDESLGLYELNKKLKLARQKGFIFNQTKKLTIKNL